MPISTSTHGEDDPPQTAPAFLEFGQGLETLRRHDARFAVLALTLPGFWRFTFRGARNRIPRATEAA